MPHPPAHSPESHCASPQGIELRDELLGRIFGYAAVARCGRPLPAELATHVAAALVAAAAKKSFLRELSGALQGVEGGGCLTKAGQDGKYKLREKITPALPAVRKVVPTGAVW